MIDFLATQSVGGTWDAIIIVIYFIGILLFGSYFGKFNKGTKDFFFGGQRFSWWLITMSIVATGIGTYSFVKYSTMGYKYGMCSSMNYINDWFFMPLFMFGWLPIIYYTRVRSIPEYFEKRFNTTTRIIVVVFILMYLLGYTGYNLLLLGTALDPILGEHVRSFVSMMFGTPAATVNSVLTIIIITAVIVGIYVTWGGQTAVIFTDLLQGFLLLVAGISIFLIGVFSLGGFGDFFSWLRPEGQLPDAAFPLAHFNRPAEYNFIGDFWGDGVASSIAFLFMNQGIIMRFLSIKSVPEGRKAIAFNTIVFLPFSAIVVAGAGWIGLAMTNAGMNLGINEPNNAFVKITNFVASEGFFGFVIAALVAALMSTVSTYLNAISAVFVNDLYRPYLMKGRKDKHYLGAARVSSAVAVVIGLLIVPIFMNFRTLYEAHAAFISTVTPPTAVAIFLGFVWKRYTNKAVIASLALGAVAIVYSHINPMIIQPLAHGTPFEPESSFSYMRAFYGVLVCGIIGIIVSLFTKGKTDKQLEGLTLWTMKNARRNFKGAEPNDKVGEKVVVEWKYAEKDFEESEDAVAYLSENDLKRLAAEEGDLIYITDSRKWLGGLLSVHTKVGEGKHPETGIVYLPKVLKEHAQFKEGRSLRIEKIF